MKSYFRSLPIILFQNRLVYHSLDERDLIFIFSKLSLIKDGFWNESKQAFQYSSGPNPMEKMFHSLVRNSIISLVQQIVGEDIFRIDPELVRILYSHYHSTAIVFMNRVFFATG